MLFNAPRFFAILFSVVSTTAFANIFQPPIPVSQDTPLRLLGGAFVSSNFSSLNRLGGGVGLTHHIGEGFEWGAGITGYAASEQLFASSDISGWTEFDGMFRFFGDVNDCVNLGLQIDVGYAHDFSHISNVGLLLVGIGVPLAFGIEDVAHIFLLPGIHLGSLRPGEEGRVFGTGVGASIQVGTAFNIGGPQLWIAARPRINDFKNATAVAGEFTVGVAYDM